MVGIHFNQVKRALSFALLNEGVKMLNSKAMIEITTSNSIKVNALG
jgi:hypothetical protein